MLKILLNIVGILLLIAGIRYLGIKGIIGFLSGMLFMGFIITSKNPLILWFLEQFDARFYVDEINKKK